MRRRARVQIAVATLSGNSLKQTVHTHCASVHQAAKLVVALLKVAGVTAGLAESNGSLPPGLWLTSPAGWLPGTGISSGILRSVIVYGLTFFTTLIITHSQFQRYSSWNTELHLSDCIPIPKLSSITSVIHYFQQTGSPTYLEPFFSSLGFVFGWPLCAFTHFIYPLTYSLTCMHLMKYGYRQCTQKVKGSPSSITERMGFGADPGSWQSACRWRES